MKSKEPIASEAVAQQLAFRAAHLRDSATRLEAKARELNDLAASYRAQAEACAKGQSPARDRPTRGDKTPERDGLPFGIIDPDYARFYTIARLTAWQEGYALTLHGSFTRDLDLVAVPWADHACSPDDLIRHIEYRTGLKAQGAPSVRPFGRMTWTLLFPNHDPRFVDISVTPRAY